MKPVEPKDMLTFLCWRTLSHCSVKSFLMPMKLRVSKKQLV